MQVIVHGRLVGADCSAPCRMGVPSADESLRLCGFEPIDIRLPFGNDSEGLPYKFVGDSNDRHLAGLAVGPETVKTCLALGIAPERRERRYIKLASQG